MTRPLAMLLALLMTLPLAVARADEAVTETPEEPSMQVVCLGDAMAPELLRFAFQSEPAGRIRPEVLRTADTRRRNQAAAPRDQQQTARAPQGPPTLRLPCISG
jgi:hypothetical protein